MADIAELPLAIPSSFTVNGDVYLGITKIDYSTNEGEYIGHVPEGDKKPSRRTQIESDKAAVEGTISSNSHSVLQLRGVEVTGATTIDFVNLADGTTERCTLTNASFKGATGNADRRTVGGAGIKFEADEIVIAPAA